MKTNRILFTILACGVSLMAFPLSATLCGKIDVGPTYAHIDVLESNRTVRRMDLPAIKGDATLVFYEGWCFKPSILYGKNEGELLSTGLGFGRCIPINDCFLILPSIGVTYTQLLSSFNLKTEIEGYPKPIITEMRERLRSVAPYVGLYFSYKFAACWKVNGYIQYAYSRAHTRVKSKKAPKFHKTYKNHSTGPNIGLQLERIINECWSINLGAAYNRTLSKERHGLRGHGMKIGFVYTL